MRYRAQHCDHGRIVCPGNPGTSMHRSIVACLIAILFIFTSVQRTSAAVAPQAGMDRERATPTRMACSPSGFAHAPEGRFGNRGCRSSTIGFRTPRSRDEIAQRHETRSGARQSSHGGTEGKRIAMSREDLAILRKAFDLQFFAGRTSTGSTKSPFMNASKDIFQGLRTLLDDQVSADRRSGRGRAALPESTREWRPGFQAVIPRCLKERELGQIAEGGSLSIRRKAKFETELGRNSNYVDGIADLFRKYKTWRTGSPGYARLKVQLCRPTTHGSAATYSTQGPARTFACRQRSMRSPLERIWCRPPSGSNRIDGPHRRSRNAGLKWHRWRRRLRRADGYAASDYRSVITELKKKQIKGGRESCRSFRSGSRRSRQIIVANSLVTLPDRARHHPPGNGWPKPRDNPRRRI